MEIKQDIIFTDKKGKEYTITPEVQEQWLKTFNLKSINDDFIPQFSDEVKAILEKEGVSQIKLKSGSLGKLIERERLAMLPYIKPTLETPDVILKHLDSLIFVKDIGRESFFTSVSRAENGEMIVRTNSFKTLANLRNKIKQDGEVLFLNKEASNILAETFTAKTFPNELDNVILPQKLTFDDMLGRKFDLSDEKSVNTLNDYFYTNNTDENNKELFDKTLKIAQKLNVKIEFATKNPTRSLAGIYSYSSNNIIIYPLSFINRNDLEVTNILLHEMIHSTTCRALYLDKIQAKEFLTPAQRVAISHINAIFRKVKKEYREIKIDKKEDGTYKPYKIYYGLTNVKEFLAELSNPEFREFLQERNLFIRIVDNIIKFITAPFKKAGDKETNIYALLKEKYIDLISNYDLTKFDYKKSLQVGMKHRNEKSREREIKRCKEMLQNFEEGVRKGALEYKIAKHTIDRMRENLEELYNVKPIAEFGKNYIEYYRDGKNGIARILSEAKDFERRKKIGKLTDVELEQGEYKAQVTGAFYREDIGDIDLVWGDDEIGLKKIIKKHIKDFADFKGKNAIEKLENGLSEIVEKGELKQDNNIYTIIYKYKSKIYRIGLSKGWNGEGENKWIITAYKNR